MTIDWAHFDKATMGDAKLAREVAELFVAQAREITDRLNKDGGDVGVLVHSLKGSARGIGAWDVAEAAGAFEVARAAKADSSLALAQVRKRIAEACEALAHRFRSP